MLRKKSLVKRILAFLLCICMVVTSVGLDTGISVEAAPSNKPLDDTRLHFMIRHWHHNDALNSGNDNLVEGYIEKKIDDKGDVSYSLGWKDDIKPEDSGVTFDDDNGTVTIKPLPEKDNSGVALEEFAGFTVSAGPDAVDEHLATEESAGDTNGGNYLVIRYDDNVHTVKAHVFYTETVMATGDDLGEEMQEIDTKMQILEGDTEKTKVYNTAAGLHTDKTAYETVDKDGKTDGRTFDLELESWFAGENLLDTGLVLDASGSMAFTSNNMDDKSKVYISDKEITELQEKEGIEAGDPIPEEYVDTLLDKHYTDNSKLSYSGYNYFIYDPRSTTQEYVPLAYWSGEHYVPVIDKTAADSWTDIVPTSSHLVGFYTFDGTLDNTVSTGPLGAAKLIEQANKADSNHNGIFSSEAVVEEEAVYATDGTNNKVLDLKATSEKGAVLIDLPKGAFTIAFRIKGEKFENPKPSDETQILKIGAYDSAFKNSVYYEMRRGKDTSTNRLKMYKNDSSGTNVNMNGVFASDTWHSVIITKEADAKIKCYLDGEDVTTASNVQDWDEQLNSMENVGIILGGLIDSETVSHNIYLENLLVYDTAVTSGNSSKLSHLVKNEEHNKKSLKWVYLAEDDEGNIIGQIESDVAGCEPEDLCGWYYLTSNSKWGLYSDPNILTAKQLHGIPTTNTKTKNGRPVKKGDNTIFYGTAGLDQDDPSNYYYEVKNYSPSYFYYKEGDETLYCAYYATTDTYETSPVYMISDLDRIKEENLQAAVGNFIVELHEKSPDSRVSAVRFSNDSITEDDYDKLVMLDWTMDPIEATNMLGLQWGEGAAQGTSIGSTKSDPDENEVKVSTPIQQYNYGLTGGTHTWVGLQAYKEELDNRIERTLDEAGEEQEAEKYLIIFTDGKDDDYFDDDEENKNKGKAIELAEGFKEEGYTIYCVMLTGGTLSGEENINNTREYLAKLSGDEDYNPEEDEKREYPYVFQASNAAELQESFESIVDRIYFSLKQYTVQDYIDPRFDLVDIDGNTIHLNAGGKITITDKDGTDVKVEIKDEDTGTGGTGSDSTGDTVDTKKYYEYKCRSKDEKAQTARLYYDAENEMYYLRWINQEIPGCSIGAEELSVWRSRITVRAKEDFIGGNAVLTNGNQEDMNIVYAEAEETIEEGSDGIKSSGTDDMYRKDPEDEGTGSSKGNDEYPSKGFPRTTVNVKPLDYNVNGGEQLIYMGEYVTPEEILNELGESVETNDYWKFLKRYMEYSEKDTSTGEGIGTGADTGTTDEDLLEILLNEGEIKIPYTYLPESEEEKDADKESGVEQVLNQTGTNEHEADAFGIVTFTWGAADEEDEGLNTKTPYETEDTQQKEYKLTVKYEPYEDGDFPEWGAEEASSTEPSKSLAETRAKSGETEEDVKDRYTILDGEDSLIDEEVYDTPKPPVGEEVTEETQKVGTHTTSIITGEITMEMCLAKSDLDYLAEHTTKENRKITYKAKLTRSWEDSVNENTVDNTEVGTYTMTIDLDKLNDGETYKTDTIDDVEYICVEGKIDLTDEEKKAYTGNTEYALPIGTYKLEKVTEETVEPTPFKFKDIEVVTITKEDYKYFTILEFDDGYATKVTEPKSETSGVESKGTSGKEASAVSLTGKNTIVVGDRGVLTTVFGMIPNSLLEETEKTAGIEVISNSRAAVKDPKKTAKDYAAETDDDTDTFYLGTGKGTNTKDNAVSPVYTDRRLGLARVKGGLDLADIKISKTVVDTISEDTKEKDKDFTFTVTFEGESTNGDFSYTKYSPSKVAGSPESTVTTADKIKSGGTVTLKDGEYIVIEDLPVGTKVTVSEKAESYYTTTAEIKNATTGTGSGTAGKETASDDTNTVSVTLEKAKVEGENPVEVAFTNTYKAEGELELTVTKDLTGRTTDEWIDSDSFTFELTTTDKETIEAIKNGNITILNSKKEEVVVNEENNFKLTVTINSESKDHKAIFDTIKFHKTGTYKFTVKEVIPEGAVDNHVSNHITYPTEAKEVTVTVAETKTDDKVVKNGKLVVTANPDDVTITNNYVPDPVDTTVVINKEITGEPYSDHTFKFEIEAQLEDAQTDSVYWTTEDSGEPTAVKSGDKEDVTIEGTGKNDDLKITFKKAGTYNFLIKETNDSAPGYTYDNHVWKLTVEVTDNTEVGKLEAEATYEEYSVKEDGSLGEKVTSTGGTEKIDSATFTNIYEAEPDTYAPQVEKVITGDDTPADNPRTFEFTITPAEDNEEDGAVLPEETTVSVTGEGAATFGDITFKKAGTYKFTITEKAGTEKGYGYDKSEWTLTVVVEDNDKAELTVKSHTYKKVVDGTDVDSAENQDKATFTNTYTVTKTEPFTPKVKKTVTGFITGDETFNFTLTPSNENPENGAYLAGTEGTEDTLLSEAQTTSVTVKNSNAGTQNASADFPSMTFKKAGTYTFTIKEEIPANQKAGFTYDDGEWTLTVVVEDKDSQLTINADKTKYEKTKKSTDNEVSVTSPSTENAEFVNIYRTTPTTYAPQVAKVLTGETPAKNSDFKFRLALVSPVSGVELPTSTELTITGAGTASFDEIKFTKAGTYTFTITEVDSKVKGYTYDTKPWTLTVVVVDENAGLKVQSHSFSREGSVTSSEQATFTNKYEVTVATAVPKVQKTVSGEAPTRVTFTFGLSGVSYAHNPENGVFYVQADGTESPLSGDNQFFTTVEAKGNETKTGEFGTVKFKKAGNYRLAIVEKHEEKLGYEYDTSAWYWDVVVTDIGGALEITSQSYCKVHEETVKHEIAEFVNVYDPLEVPLEVIVEKRIVGDVPPSEGKYTFEIAEKDNVHQDGVVMPKDLTVDATTTDPNSTLRNFEDIIFKKAGTYNFTITEVKPEEVPEGYTYDESVWNLQVTVVDRNGFLAITDTTYTCGDKTSKTMALFENEYKVTPTSYQPQIEKTVTKQGDKEPQTADFNFYMRWLSGPEGGVECDDLNGKEWVDLDEIDTQIKITGTGTNTGKFSNLTFKKAGTYVFEILEDTNTEVSGYTFDGSVWLLTVTVEDKDSELQVTNVEYVSENDTSSSNNEMAKFENTYEECDYYPHIHKEIVGNERTEDIMKEFTFTITPTQEYAPEQLQMPENTTAVQKDHGTASFAGIKFYKEGDYDFTIKEEIPDPLPTGYTSYDSHEWKLHVKITKDSETDLLTIVPTYTCKTCEGAEANGNPVDELHNRYADNHREAFFVNHYEPSPITYNATVEKMITGTTPSDKTFEFTLIPHGEKSDAVDIPENMKATVTGSSTGTFPAMTFHEAGKYLFEIQEVDTAEKGYSYDRSLWILTVDVTDAGGTLSAKVFYMKVGDNVESETTSFENTYRPLRVRYAPQVVKTISGDTPEQDSVFTFNIEEDASSPDGAVMPLEKTVQITGAGTGTFDEIIFANVGTYKFKISETVGTEAEYAYDGSVWTLTVEVVDNDGELQIVSTTYTKDDTIGGSSAQAEFVNIYTKPEVPTEPTTEPSDPTTEVQNPENPTAPPAEVVTPPASGGSSEGTPTETNHSAKTGDEAGLGLCMLCAAFALLGMAAVRRRRKRK